MTGWFLRSPTGRVWPVVALWTVLGAAGSISKIVVDRDMAIGWVPQAVSYWSDITIPSVMVGAGLGAWLVVPLRRSGFRDLRAVGARSWAEVAGHAVLLPVLSVAIGASASLAVAVGWSLMLGAAFPVALGQCVLWWLGSIAAGSALAMVGCALGWLIPGVAGIAVAPALAYVALVGPMMTTGRPWGGLQAAVGMPWDDTVPSLVSAGSRALFWSLLVALGILIVRGRRRIAWVAAVGASAAVVVGVAEGPRWVPVPEAGSLTCHSGQPQVCTRGTYAVGLPAFATIMAEGYTLLPDQLTPAAVVTDQGLVAETASDAFVFAPSAGGSKPTNLPDREATLADLGRRVLLQGCGVQSDPAPALALVLWWRTELQVPLERPVRPGDTVPALVMAPDEYQVARDRAQSLLDLTPPERARWLDEHAAEIATCTLDPAEFPGQS